jgi:hypothetical protein
LSDIHSRIRFPWIPNQYLHLGGVARFRMHPHRHNVIEASVNFQRHTILIQVSPSNFRMSDTIPITEYDRVLAQRNHPRLEVAQLRSQLAPQVQRNLVAQTFAPQQIARHDSRFSDSARERTTTERPAKRVCVHEYNAPLASYMRAVLEQAPSAMLSMLDDATQQALWTVMPHILSARQISVAQQLWGTHWANEPFARSFEGVTRYAYNDHICDLRVILVRDDAPFVDHDNFVDCPSYSSSHVSCWEATSAGAVLKLVAWRNGRAISWRSTRREAVCVDVARLADSARRIIARASDFTGLTQSELNSFDPSRWFDHAPVRRNAPWGLWLSMVVEYSAALQIEQLVPLFETMPSGVISEMQ